MKGLLWVLALFALAVGIALALQYNDGYVLLVLPPYRAEVSLNLALALVFAAFLLFYGLLRAIALTRSLPQRVRDFRERRQREKMIETLYDAARLLFEGRFSQSLKKAGDAHAAGLSPALSALLAARSAQRLREPEKQQAWLEKAVQSDAKMQAAALMLEAEMQIEMHDYSGALTVLERLHQQSGRHIAALELELKAQQGCGHWNEVLRIVRLLVKRQALAPEMAQEITLKAHRENLQQYREDLPQLQSYLKAIPARERTPRLALTTAQALMALGAHDEAGDFIETQLAEEWDSQLIGLYGQLRGFHLAARIVKADQWLPQHRNDAQLLLALGRLCVEQHLWGKAQTYLEAALSLADQREIRLELARLFEQTERPDEAMRHYRAAAEMPA